MRKVKIIGGGITKFGRHLDRNLKSLVAEAVNEALKDAGINDFGISRAGRATAAAACATIGRSASLSSSNSIVTFSRTSSAKSPNISSSDVVFSLSVVISSCHPFPFCE